jgi:hypothetical protein
VAFKSNGMERIPEGTLPRSLQWLTLTSNALTSLPNDIGKLSHLRKLLLSDNRLRTLPASIVQCESLELVRLGDNGLQRLPGGFLSLPRLAWLGLGGNPALVRSSARVPPTVAHEEVRRGVVLGQGASGTVYRARVRMCGVWRTVALKQFKEAGGSDGCAGNEVAAYCAVPPHAALVSCVGVVPRPHTALLLEFVDGYQELGRPPSFESVTRDVFAPGTALSAAAVLEIGVQVQLLVHANACCEPLVAGGVRR